jgi:hypothetical protein
LLFIIDNKFFKNIGILLLVFCILPMSAMRDMHAQKIWKIAFDNELLLQNRILDRIETNSNFDINKKYTYIVVGEIPIYRKKYYNLKYDISSPPLLDFSYVPYWIPSLAINFLSYKIFIQDSFFVGMDNNTYDVFANKELYDFILNKAKSWPSLDSVFVSDNYILVIMGDEALLKLKDYIKINFLEK